MMRLISIALALTLTMQSVQLSLADIARMDDLVEHMQFHREQYGDDLAGFFAKHYGDDREAHHEEHEEERPQHDQLPFQHLGTFITFQTVDFNKTLILGNPEISEYRSEANFHYCLRLPSPFTTSIFQPPKQT